MRPAAPELDLHEDVVAVGLECVERDQGEAVVGDLFLVDGLAVELRRGGDGTADQGAAPDQGDGARPPVLARQRPITSSLRSIFQSGLSSARTSVKSAVARKPTGSPSPRLDVGDVAEELERALVARAARRAGDPDPPAPGALREPVDLLRHRGPRGQVADPLEGLDEGLTQPRGEAPRGMPSWLVSAMKRGIGRGSEPRPLTLHLPGGSGAGSWVVDRGGGTGEPGFGAAAGGRGAGKVVLRGVAAVRGAPGGVLRAARARPRCVPGVSWRPRQGVAATRRPGREGSGGSRRRDGTKSDFRDRPQVDGPKTRHMVGFSAHRRISGRSVTKMPGTSPGRHALRPPGA